MREEPTPVPGSFPAVGKEGKRKGRKTCEEEGRVKQNSNKLKYVPLSIFKTEEKASSALSRDP
jgi:hypothetical protein